MVFNGDRSGHSVTGAEADDDVVEDEDERPGMVEVVAKDEIELADSDVEMPVSTDTREFQRNKGYDSSREWYVVHLSCDVS